MCPSNSPAGEVQIPVGYTYHAATNKYYKPYKGLQDWEGAQLKCSSDGATLIESRTSAEHEKLRWMFGELENVRRLYSVLTFISTDHHLESNDFWTGLVNPNKMFCIREATCLNIVHWVSDGIPYDTEVYPGHKLFFNNGYFCARYQDYIDYQTGNFGIDDKDCSAKYYFACEFSCNLNGKTTKAT